AYHENFLTQRMLTKTKNLHFEIVQSRARLRVLRAEWAYLNRPERLNDLANLNFDRLGLFSLSSDHFGRADQVAYPPSVSLPKVQPASALAPSAEVRP
ncbi:MAG: cell division protein FtsL, partial [Paracoccaceae bacterium]|nr:cell division protein FtsL [Paracoccaceae bacterium]